MFPRRALVKIRTTDELRRTSRHLTGRRIFSNVERESKTATWGRRLGRGALLPVRLFCAAALRMLVTAAVFLICTGVALRLLGYELPGASVLEPYLESIEQLADVLS